MRSAQPRSAWPVVEPHNTVGKHDTFAEQAETCTAEHLALEHLDPPESQGGVRPAMTTARPAPR